MTKATHLKKYDVIMVAEEANIEDIKNDSTKLPTDIHVVSYHQDGQLKVDAVRSVKMSDVFDAYYDYGLKEIESIKNGYGSIRPNLYNAQQPKDKD